MHGLVAGGLWAVLSACSPSTPQDGEPARRAAAPGDPGARWFSHVEALANDEMRGRETGSPEHRKAAEYVAEHFKAAGLQPAGTDAYLQPVAFRSRKIDESQSSLAILRDGKVTDVIITLSERPTSNGTAINSTNSTQK